MVLVTTSFAVGAAVVAVGDFVGFSVGLRVGGPVGEPVEGSAGKTIGKASVTEATGGEVGIVSLHGGIKSTSKCSS